MDYTIEIMEPSICIVIEAESDGDYDVSEFIKAARQEISKQYDVGDVLDAAEWDACRYCIEFEYIGKKTKEDNDGLQRT